MRVEPGEPAEAVAVVAVLVERPDDRQPERLAQLVVLGAAAGRDMDDARALVLADLVPGDDAMLVRPAFEPSPAKADRTASRSSYGPR